MSAPDPSDVEAQRRLLRRMSGEARRWLLRGVLLLVMAISSFTRGGSLFNALGGAFLLLAAMTYLMSRQTKRSVAELSRRLETQTR